MIRLNVAYIRQKALILQQKIAGILQYELVKEMKTFLGLESYKSKQVIRRTQNSFFSFVLQVIIVTTWYDWYELHKSQLGEANVRARIVSMCCCYEAGCCSIYYYYSIQRPY